MQQLLILRKLYDLKIVYRDIPIQNKYESSAEHSRSAMLLADYFMGKMDLPLNRLKVFELLLYHDLAEIETGDVSLADTTDARKNKQEAERQAMEKIVSTLPPFMGEKYQALYEEFEAKLTPEAKFAHAMDKLDAELQCFNPPEEDREKMKEAFVPYSEELVRQKGKYYTDYPDVEEASEKIIQFFKENGYLSEE